jgi:Mrp family chromosome partitioning ATPase
LATANNNPRVLLVDLNFDSPAVHKVFRAQLGPGLAECLGDGRPWDEILQPVPGSNVTLATAGTAARNGQGVAAERLRDLVRFAADRFDFAIFDLPPLNRLSDTLPACEWLDGVLLLVEAERVRWPVAKRFVTGLERSGAKTLGAVMNKRREHIPGWLYRAL